jgi:catechol 2,3-dioxygenase-like lactoylglutathione lyase family enzyme
LAMERVDHLAIGVSDLDRSVGFYGDMLGFEEFLRFNSKMPGIRRISLMRLREMVIELIELEDPKDFKEDPVMPGFKHLCLLVADFDREYGRLKELGVRVLEGPHVLNEEHLEVERSLVDVDMKKGLARAVFADPDGLPIEILKWL